MAFRVSMHDDEVERVIKCEDGGKSARHVSCGRWIQASKIRCDHIHLESMALGDASDVPTQRLIRWTIGQQERARRHASIKTI